LHTPPHHHHHQQQQQRIIVAAPSEIKLGSTTFRFGLEHERKMSSIDPATEHAAHVQFGDQ